MNTLIETVETLTDSQIKMAYRSVQNEATRDAALVRAALYTAWENRHGNESAEKVFDALDSE